MTTQISDRIARLYERKYDPQTRRPHLKEASRGLGSIPQEVQKYLQMSMEPVDRAYTEESYAECSKVAKQVDQLLGRHDISVEFDVQGSVTNNTHIRYHSDVDLLVLPKHFLYLQPPLVPSWGYQGDPVEELLEIRRICEESLPTTFPSAELEMGAKAVSISGGSLGRKVDVVPASWLDTEAYRASNNKMHRGVCVLDTRNRLLIDNFPFLHNARIEARDRQTNGGLRRLIRLVKSIRADSDVKPNCSSYHITALCFHLPLHKFSVHPRRLLHNFFSFVYGLIQDEESRSSFFVPNKTERVFDRLDPQELIKLALEVADLAIDKAALVADHGGCPDSSLPSRFNAG
jgi:hypothetical protein